jgi:Tfp pilus assembly protein PilF
MASQRQIFISYAREDRDQKEKIFDLLVNNLDLNQYIPWKDDMIPAGRYEYTIKEEIRNSQYYLLLISKSFVNSEFIKKNELPLILEECSKNKILIPIILSDYTREELVKALPEISNYQFFPKKQENLSLFETNELALSQLANDLVKSFSKETHKWVKATKVSLSTVAVIAALVFGYKYFIEPSETCPNFDKTADVKTLIFPVDKRNSTINNIMDTRFALACKKYKLKSDNQFDKSGKANLSTGELLQKAKACQSDLLLSGSIISDGNQQYFNGFFEFTDDAINLYQPSFQTIENTLQPITIKDLVGSTKLNESYDQLALNIIGFLSYKKGDYKNTIAAIKDSRIDTIKNKAFKLSSYKILSDAYLKENQLDSSISCLNKMSKWFPDSTNFVLKKAILATQAKQNDVAIESYTKVLKDSRVNRDVLLEKRGDLFVETKDFANARKDFQEAKAVSKTPKKYDTKIIMVDKRIQDNKNELNRINAQKTHLTNEEKFKITELHLQNGEVDKAKLILDKIPQPANADSAKYKQLKYEIMLEKGNVKANQIPKSALNNATRLKSKTLIK